MSSPNAKRRLVVNADDFGRSASINEAVIRAHREGVLTTASLMVTGGAVEEAVELARENPKLGVGLHLTLVCGSSAEAPEKIRGLVDSNGNFSNNAPAAGFRYFSNPSLRPQLVKEVQAQFARFKATGLQLDHVNGHLHFHLHPTVFSLVEAGIRPWGIKAMRLTREPISSSWNLGKGRYFYRLSHYLIFKLLSASARTRLVKSGVAFTDRVFGLLENARVDSRYLAAQISRLAPGSSEIFSHPSMDEFRNEFEAMISPDVRDAVDRNHVQLVRYQDLVRSV